MKDVLTIEVFGHTTDVVVESIYQDGVVTIMMTTMLPALRYEDGKLRSYPPPRYPWPTRPTSAKTAMKNAGGQRPDER